MIFSEGDQNMYLCVFLFIMFPLYSNNCISSRYLSSKYVIISNTANFRLKYVHYRFNCHYPEVIIICCKQRGVVMGKKFWKKATFFSACAGLLHLTCLFKEWKKTVIVCTATILLSFNLMMWKRRENSNDLRSD